MKEKFNINRQLSELYRDHEVYLTPLPGIRFNDFIRISNRTGRWKKRSIYVWIRLIDDYYRRFYNSTTEKRFGGNELCLPDDVNSIVLCRHYRVKLGLSEGNYESVELEIRKCRNPLKRIKALYNAPDSVTRTTTVISIISLFLGVVALVLGVMSIM